MNYIGRQQLHPEIQEQLEELKKMHDYSYAKKCVLDKLEKEYQDMIDTDIWYEAAKKYCNDRINSSELETLIFNFRSDHNLWDYETGTLTYSGGAICYGDITSTTYIRSSINDWQEPDTKFLVSDGEGETRWLSLNELHVIEPDVELKDDFKMHCIKYKRRYEE